MDTSIRLLQESDLTTADRIFRLAFGTFIGLPYPDQFGGDANYIQHRFWAEPTAAFAAFVDGELVGSRPRNKLGELRIFWTLECPS